MTVPRTTRWAIEPHTQIKHLILRKYLDTWLPMLSRYNDRIVYVDGFAGPGRYSGGEEGSPLIALRALLEHGHLQGPHHPRAATFLFIERDKKRARDLEQELKLEFVVSRRRKQAPDPPVTQEGNFLSF